MKTPQRPDDPVSQQHYPLLHFRTSSTSWARCSCGLTFGVVRTDEGTARHVAWLRAHRVELAGMDASRPGPRPMNGDGLEMGPDAFDDETADAIEQLPPLLRVSLRLIPVPVEKGDPWPLVVGLETTTDGLPAGLTTRQLFELLHRSLPRLERDARRSWAARK